MILYLYKLGHVGSTKKKQSLRKKNTRKKTPKEDCELSYSDFTLSLTFLLPYPKKNRMVGEANLWRIAPKTYQHVGGSGFSKPTGSSTEPL